MLADVTWWAGLGMGLSAAVISIGGWWLIIRLGVRSATAPADARIHGRRNRTFAFLSVLAFLMKLPLFVLLAILTHRLGPVADTGFLIGMGLVYSALIGQAILRNRADFHTP